MRSRARRSFVRVTGVACAALAVVALVAGGCQQCPTCPRHTEPARAEPPSASH